MNQQYLVLDYETRSRADLKKIGGWEYSVHPSTQVLCVAWRLGTFESLRKTPTKVWSPAIPSPYGEFVGALLDPAVRLVAHNAFFEQVITKNVLSRIVHKPGLKEIPVLRWECTAARARALALPGKLAEAGAALGLKVQKDMQGHRLMLKMAKPRKATKKSSAPWHSKLSDLKRLMEYCKTDIDVETELLLKLPPLSPLERRVWELDQKMNLRGFAVDREFVISALSLIDSELANLDAETRQIGEPHFTSTNQRAKVLKWIVGAPGGLPLPDLKAKTVADALAGDILLPGSPARRILEIRQAVSKSSTAKYEAFNLRSMSDGRIRDSLVYHAASTGRWGGAGLQPQNFPRGHIKDTNEAIEIVKERDLEWLRMMCGDPMSVLSSCLRGGIIPSEGKDLFCADFASIEVRVLFWMAKHAAGVQAYAEDRKLYEEMAAEIYDVDMEEIENPSLERDMGKRTILGAGYQMGWEKFMLTCESYGQPISKELAMKAISAYRRVHAPVVQFWYNLEKASIAATKKPGTLYQINRTGWIFENGYLWCILPSGRKLAYKGPEIRLAEDKFGNLREKFYHWGQNPKTRKWECAGTYGGRLVENVVQATARDLMAEAALRIESAGYEILTLVHDEAVAERHWNRGGSVKEFEKLMTTLPPWAKGCPIQAKGWSGDRYKK